MPEQTLPSAQRNTYAPNKWISVKQTNSVLHISFTQLVEQVVHFSTCATMQSQCTKAFKIPTSLMQTEWEFLLLCDFRNKPPLPLKCWFKCRNRFPVGWKHPQRVPAAESRFYIISNSPTEIITNHQDKMSQTLLLDGLLTRWLCI